MVTRDEAEGAVIAVAQRMALRHERTAEGATTTFELYNGETLLGTMIFRPAEWAPMGFTTDTKPAHDMWRQFRERYFAEVLGLYKLRKAFHDEDEEYPRRPEDDATREDWFRYKLLCDKHPFASFGHKELAKELNLTHGYVRQEYAKWKAGIDVENT